MGQDQSIESLKGLVDPSIAGTMTPLRIVVVAPRQG